MSNKISKLFGTLVLALFTVLVFSACGGESTENQNNTTDPATAKTTDPEVVVDAGDSHEGHDHEGHDHDGHDHGDSGNDGNTGNNNNGGNETTPPPPPPPAAAVAFESLGGNVAAGSKFYIDVMPEKATGTAHQVKVEGGVKVEGTAKMGEGANAYERVTFSATEAGPATIKIARVDGKALTQTLTNKDWVKAKAYTLTVN